MTANGHEWAVNKNLNRSRRDRPLVEICRHRRQAPRHRPLWHQRSRRCRDETTRHDQGPRGRCGALIPHLIGIQSEQGSTGRVGPRLCTAFHSVSAGRPSLAQGLPKPRPRIGRSAGQGIAAPWAPAVARKNEWLAGRLPKDYCSRSDCNRFSGTQESAEKHEIFKKY